MKETPDKFVYYFGDGSADGDGGMKPLLGGKGANLAEMTRLGLPVPPGFTITTEVCTFFYDSNKAYPPELSDQVESALAQIETSVGKRLGNRANPLLLSVRSGARDSMPGMMDTILNLGMNDDVRGYRDAGSSDLRGRSRSSKRGSRSKTRSHDPARRIS